MPFLKFKQLHCLQM